MGMRQRWLLRTSLAAGIAGLLCVLLGTAIFAGCIYAARVEEIGEYVDTAKAFFDDRVNKSEAEYYDACVIYTQTGSAVCESCGQCGGILKRGTGRHDTRYS